MANLFDPITVLSGIGPHRAQQFAQLGINTVYDLLSHFPKTYEDRRKMVNIADLEPGQPACFSAHVIEPPETDFFRKPGKKRLTVTKVTVADASSRLHLTFFNQQYLDKQFKVGEEYIFYGNLSHDLIGLQIVNPLFERKSEAGIVTQRIVPVYTLVPGLSNNFFSRTVQQALDSCADSLPEVIPQSVRRQYHLYTITDAYRQIHDPSGDDALKQAKTRLIFEEFFIFSAGLQLLRQRRTKDSTIPMTLPDMAPFYDALSFRLTDAQQRCIREILRDLSTPTPMNRLLQGDVGSGKTAVAAAAIFCTAKNAGQAAMMVPTEILAAQHFTSLSQLLAPLGIRCALLTSSMRTPEKRSVLAAISAGDAQLVIGTHALISQNVQFQNLRLVITDEQHRFGVAQRAALSEKGVHPNLLVMSATPIPRTLSLILYGDLDVSILDTRPPGRQTVDTFLVNETMRTRINAFIRKQIALGHQCYIVCPAVEEHEADSLKSATLWAQTLQQVLFPDLRVGLIHGKLKTAEKEQTMQQFSAGAIDILVATTVIEVGVDVPNATLMVIENAERFGLSQLHQLRGRVGRGQSKSYCVLFSSNPGKDTAARLNAFCRTNDGFRIAEDDLALRGPGDFLGYRQHGLPSFKVANLQLDLPTLREAQAAAQAYLQDPSVVQQPEFRFLSERIHALFHTYENTLN